MKNGANSILVFDMDGVLVDVSESYLATIAATVEQITGTPVSRETIQRYKNAGGWNNDWALAQKLVLEIANLEIPYEEIVAIFQNRFLGANHDGLILRERWLPDDGLLERLATSHRLAIFTGRPRAEVSLTLQRFAPRLEWAMIVSDMEAANPKPAPDGLLMMAEKNPGSALTYFGDTVDDAQSAMEAGVRFIGVADANVKGLRKLLEDAGAECVIENINEIEEVL